MGMQTWKTAVLDITSSIYKHVKLKESTSSKEFPIPPNYVGKMTINSMSSKPASLTAVDAQTGEPYFVNGKKQLEVALSPVGTPVKIYISDSKYY